MARAVTTPRSVGMTWIVVIVGVLLAVLWFLVDLAGRSLAPAERDYFVRIESLPTLLQVVPATVVAVFVFAAGTLFVIAQVIHSPLGSRSVDELLRSSRVRGVLVAGVLLLMVSLALVVIAPQDRASAERLDFIRTAGTVLATATVVYAPVAVGIVVRVLATFVHPEDYTSRLAGSGRSHRASRAWQRPHEQMFRRVRALRQWLRISCGSGESRDVTFALLGMRRLVEEYVERAQPEVDRTTPRRTWWWSPVPLRESSPQEYDETQVIARSHWRSPTVQAGDGGSEDGPLLGWFGAELGRAFVRSLETGLLQNALLIRDADRLVGEMRWAVERLAAAELYEEAGYLLDRIVEIGHFGRLTGDTAYRNWCGRVAGHVLLGVAARRGPEGAVPDEPCAMPVRHGDRQAEGPQQEPHQLRYRALTAWTLVVFEMSTLSSDLSGPPPERLRYGPDWARWLERHRLDRALRDAKVPIGDGEDVMLHQLVDRLADDISWLETDTSAPTVETMEQARSRLAQLVREVIRICRTAQPA